MNFIKHQDGWVLVHGKYRLSVHRRYRASWFGHELCRTKEGNFVMVGIAHPRKHAWWATMAYFYWR